MTQFQIRNEISWILSCIRQTPDSQFMQANFDWKYVCNVCVQLRIAPLIYHCIGKHNLSNTIPYTELEYLQKHYNKTIQKNTILYHTWTIISAEFRKKNIDVVPLKGIFLAETVYGDISMRQLSDMDILIQRKHIPDGVQILTNMGFTFDERYKKSDFIQDLRDSKHIPLLAKQGIGIELHTSLIIEDKGFCIPMQDFWTNTKPAKLSDMDCLQFHPHYLLIHICMHLDEHFVSAKIHFIAYVDILHCITTYTDTIHWDELYELCRNYGCEEQVFSHIYLTSKYLQAHIPAHIALKAEQLCSAYKEEYFLHHIHCDTSYSPKKKNRNIAELAHIKGWKAKCLYLLHDMFPSKTFMINRYRITNHKFYPFYYIRRIFDGFISLVKYVLGIGKV